MKISAICLIVLCTAPYLIMSRQGLVQGGAPSQLSQASPYGGFGQFGGNPFGGLGQFGGGNPYGGQFGGNPYGQPQQQPALGQNPFGGQFGGNPYGGNPYGGNPYGGQYGGNPYGGNPYGNPFGQNYGQGICQPSDRDRQCLVYNPVPSCVCYNNGTCESKMADQCSACNDQTVRSAKEGCCAGDNANSPSIKGVCAPDERDRQCLTYNPVPSCVCYFNGTCSNQKADRCTDCGNEDIYSINNGYCYTPALANSRDICQEADRGVQCFAFIPDLRCVCYFNGTCATENTDRCASCGDADVASVSDGCCSQGLGGGFPGYPGYPNFPTNPPTNPPSIPNFPSFPSFPSFPTFPGFPGAGAAAN